jgi:hypothetical protein
MISPCCVDPGHIGGSGRAQFHPLVVEHYQAGPGVRRSRLTEHVPVGLQLVDKGTRRLFGDLRLLGEFGDTNPVGVQSLTDARLGHGTAVADPLMVVLVHGQDIAIPLGVRRTMPIPNAVVVAERLWGMRFPFQPSRRFTEVEFLATDAAFTVGKGQTVCGPIHDIVLVLSDRPAGLAGLSGRTHAARWADQRRTPRP